MSILVAVLIVLIFVFGLNRGEKPFVTNNWKETYSPQDKGPYGTYVMKELLDTTGLFGNFIELDSDIGESLVDNEDVNDIYFFIGKRNYMSDEAAEELIYFVENGNTAFLSTEQLPFYLEEYFFLDSYKIYESVIDSSQTFKFKHPKYQKKKFKFDYIYNNEIDLKYWDYFVDDNYELWDESEVFVLGRNEKKQANFVKITYGEGAFYFHSTPYLFTNVCMLKKHGFEYAEIVLEHIPPGKIQWDKYNLYDNSSDNGDGDGDGGDGNASENRSSPLEFIFKNKELIWAFLVFLFAVIMYTIFKGKRMQNIIHPKESKENTSFQYIETISSLYLQQNQHYKLVLIKEKNFLNYLSEKYYLTTNKANDDFIRKLAEKSKVEINAITEIFKLFQQFKDYELVSADMLVVLQNKLEYFYKNAK